MTREQGLEEAIVKLACAIQCLSNDNGVIYKMDVDYAYTLAEEAIFLARNEGTP